MKTLALEDQFHSWLLSTYNDPDFAGKIHCFTVRKRVLLMPGDVLDFVSVRHDPAETSDGKGLFSVGLWKFNVGAIDLDAVHEMGRHLLSFRSGVAEALNSMEMKGEIGSHSVGVHGNLVGAVVTECSSMPLLANGFGDLSFWTYRQGVNRIEVEPYYHETAPRPRLFRSLFASGLCSAGRKKARSARALTPT